MTQWLDVKYVGLLSSRFRNFKRKSSTLWNMSCPVCNDSRQNKSRARGYIYEKTGKLVYYCHNCGYSSNIPNLIKTLDQSLYQEYLLEKLSDSKPKEQTDFEDFVKKMKKPSFITNTPLKNLKKVSQLSHDDKVKKFVVSRNIPNEYHAKLFSCPNFKHYVNGLIPNKFSKESLLRDETRLLIPYIKNNNVHGMNFRAVDPSDIKYIKIVLDDDIPNVYGLDTVNFNKKVFVFEGEFDSMFVKNSIATGGGDLVSAIRTFNKDNLVIVYDNEKRSKETIKKIDKAIMNGYSVCIWPSNLDHKDINEMINAGLTSEFIEHIIRTNTYRDLAAKMALGKWSKA